MAVNTVSSFQADVEQYIADKTLPLVRRQLVVYQFGDPLELPKGRGATYTATRYQRVPLPFAPLSEGVPPAGELLTIQQVSATALQWGDKITITDVAELTIKHPLFKKAVELTGLQVSETLERNTFNALMGFTQVNFVNSRGSRASLVTGDVINIHEMNDTKIEANAGGARASSNPRTMPHYVAVLHPFVAGDFRENSAVNQAWSYSDINRLYNYELGEWSGIRFCMSNLVPSFVGVAQITATAAGGGNLGAGTYAVQVTASDNQNQFESRIYQVQTGLVVGANGTISVVLPALTGFTFNVYVSQPGSTSPVNLGLTTAGPTVGPMQGQATQLAPGQTVVITGIGTAQVPPAAPATGVTVYPTFIFGRGAYGQIRLDDVKFTYLKEGDKSDPLNQLRIVGWKCFYGTLIQNQQFAMRLESTSAFNLIFG